MSAKGQASLLDILMLGFVISIVVVVSLYVGSGYVESAIAGKETSYASTMLSSLMNYRGDSYGSYSNTNGYTVAEAINLYFCGSGISSDDMNQTVKRLLEGLVKPGYNYIFYTYGVSEVTGFRKEIWVYNNQKDVCARYIPLKSYSINMTCNVSYYVEPMLGLWPSWKEIPPKEACSFINQTGGE